MNTFFVVVGGGGMGKQHYASQVINYNLTLTVQHTHTQRLYLLNKVTTCI